MLSKRSITDLSERCSKEEWMESIKFLRKDKINSAYNLLRWFSESQHRIHLEGSLTHIQFYIFNLFKFKFNYYLLSGPVSTHLLIGYEAVDSIRGF
jgi:hypothetical protein